MKTSGLSVEFRHGNCVECEHVVMMRYNESRLDGNGQVDGLRGVHVPRDSAFGVTTVDRQKKNIEWIATKPTWQVVPQHRVATVIESKPIAFYDIAEIEVPAVLVNVELFMS